MIEPPEDTGAASSTGPLEGTGPLPDDDGPGRWFRPTSAQRSTASSAAASQGPSTSTAIPPDLPPNARPAPTRPEADMPAADATGPIPAMGPEPATGSAPVAGPTSIAGPVAPARPVAGGLPVRGRGPAPGPAQPAQPGEPSDQQAVDPEPAGADPSATGRSASSGGAVGRPDADRALDSSDITRRDATGKDITRGDGGRGEIAPSIARNTVGNTARKDEIGGQDDPIDGAVRDSFAELAATALHGGDHAVEVSEAAEPTRVPLLLHSLSDLREIWLPLLQASGARSIAEIGSESGVTTSLLVDLLRRGGGGRLLVIDPDPGVTPTSGGGLDVDVVRGFSPEALDGHAPTDAYLIDGDHNYATVRGELGMIDEAVRSFGRSYFPLVILHDVGWPAGRRDQYYGPDRLPESARQPHSWDVGVEIDKKDAIQGRGFRGMGAFAWALTEGGPRNGVRTAIEDFVAEHPDLRFFTIAPVFGLGVVLDRRAPWSRHAADLLAPWVSNTLLARMERNRIDLYLRVLALQDDAVAAARARQREWARLDDERSRLAALELQRLARISELEQELATERAKSPWSQRPDEPTFVTAARLAKSALRARLSDHGSPRTGGGTPPRTGISAVDRISGAIGRARGDAGTSGRSALPALRRAQNRPDR